MEQKPFYRTFKKYHSCHIYTDLLLVFYSFVICLNNAHILHYCATAFVKKKNMLVEQAAKCSASRIKIVHTGWSQLKRDLDNRKRKPSMPFANLAYNPIHQFCTFFSS